MGSGIRLRCVLAACVVLAWLPALPTARADDGDWPLPLLEECPGLGWYVSSDAMGAVRPEGSRRHATGDHSMSVVFTAERGARQGFVLYPLNDQPGGGISIGGFEGVGFYYAGSGIKSSIRIGMMVAPRPELGEKEPQRFTIELPLDSTEWTPKSLRWNDFWHSDDRRLLDGRDRLLGITINLAPPPVVPNQCWIDGLMLLKKYRKMPAPAPEPPAFTKPVAFEPAEYAVLFGLPDRSRRLVVDQKPLRLLVVCGPEGRAEELWNLPGKPIDYVFYNVFVQRLAKDLNVKGTQVNLIGNVTDSIRYDGATLVGKIKSATERAAVMPEELKEALKALDPIPPSDIDEVTESNFDLMVVFFSYLDTATDPKDYIEALQTILKNGQQRLSIPDVVVISPLPTGDNLERSAKLASRVKQFCRENKIPYVDAYSAFMRNGGYALREMMVDARRMDWQGHDAVARIMIELLRKAPE